MERVREAAIVVRHTPLTKANNVISATGGWQSGAASSWNSNISKTNTQEIIAYPGVLYPFSYGGEIICSVAGILYQVGNSAPPVAGFTPIQHKYPNKPLSVPCWVSQFFDHVNSGSAHHAEDVVQSNSGNTAGITVPYGTPVYASEGGTVVSEASGNGPAAAAYPNCVGTGALVNYVKIKGSDGYYTVYAHVTPTVGLNASVSAGQQIGVTDKSGCQSGGHLHMARKDPNNNPVKFTIPCVNPTPTSKFADGLVNDDVPSTL